MKQENGSGAVVKQENSLCDRVKNIIAIASGKGGVGKSTVTVNIAFTLKTLGYQVGILDADVYGPSQGKMLGIADGTRPGITKHKNQNFYIPIETHGLQVMSMAFLADKKTPMIWRGPMASGALQQMLLKTWWNTLDFLLVDLPPGTGDIQLTLSQKASLRGSVIVTTPQELALLDARRAIEMFNKVNVPVLGIVENMATHICAKCGEKDSIFGEKGAEKLAREYGVTCLGSLPLDSGTRESADLGVPVVANNPESHSNKVYSDIARNMLDEITRTDNDVNLPIVEVEDE